MALPSKEAFLAALGIAAAAAATAIEHIFETVPDAEAAKEKVLAYLAQQFAPEVIARTVDGVGQELVALVATGQSEVKKSLADLS